HRRQAPLGGDVRGAGQDAGLATGAVGGSDPPRPGARVSPAEPKVVAFGGGHGLYATLSAIRRFTSQVTAVVTVADDGGSSGRLRAELDQIPPGDLRMALAALAGEAPDDRLWTRLAQHRFGGSGALAGHAVGNLALAGLTEALRDAVGKLAGLRHEPR